jgi:hypothetical protein
MVSQPKGGTVITGEPDQLHAHAYKCANPANRSSLWVRAIRTHSRRRSDAAAPAGAEVAASRAAHRSATYCSDPPSMSARHTGTTGAARRRAGRALRRRLHVEHFGRDVVRRHLGAGDELALDRERLQRREASRGSLTLRCGWGPLVSKGWYFSSVMVYAPPCALGGRGSGAAARSARG